MTSDLVLYSIGVLIGVILGLWPIRLLINSISNHFFWRKIRKTEQKTLNKMKDNICNQPHNWIKMKVFNPKSLSVESTHVCTVCAYIPSIDGFCTRESLDKEISIRKWEVRVKKKMEKLAEKNNVSYDWLYNILLEYETIPEELIKEGEL